MRPRQAAIRCPCPAHLAAGSLQWGASGSSQQRSRGCKAGRCRLRLDLRATGLISPFASVYSQWRALGPINRAIS